MIRFFKWHFTILVNITSIKKLIFPKTFRLGKIFRVPEALTRTMVKDGPIMTIAPFLTLNLRGKKDAVLARQRARRVASLLNFDPREQTCIAAGTFVVACQALLMLGRAKICFQLENQYLHVFAEEISPHSEGTGPAGIQRLAGFFPSADGSSLYRLAKLLPARDLAADEVELGWLVNQVEATACRGLFDEIVRQNQEVLSLLHELRLYQENLQTTGGKIHNPHAA